MVVTSPDPGPETITSRAFISEPVHGLWVGCKKSASFRPPRSVEGSVKIPPWQSTNVMLTQSVQPLTMTVVLVGGACGTASHTGVKLPGHSNLNWRGVYSSPVILCLPISSRTTFVTITLSRSSELIPMA